MKDIPVLDWQRFASGSAEEKRGFVADLGVAARNTGFFVLANHSLPPELIDQTFATGDAFFALPAEAKDAVAIHRSGGTNRGYAGQGTEALDEASGIKDRKEAFNVGLELAADDPRMGEPFRAQNLWPETDGFRETTLAYYDAVLDLGTALHRAVALDLGLEENHFDSAFNSSMATLRLLNYPAGDSAGSIGAGAHTDYGSLTLLMTDGVGGLQVRPRGLADWIHVPHVPGAFVVNIGDCLMRWTNDIYVSTPHRVVAPPKARRSIAFFLDPNPDVSVAALPGTGAPKYEPVLASDYLAARLSATYEGTP
ncbi:MAG: 2-oxoglutarate and iron-dependent oxygenase domain-containing protein [Pseudomonadota bacterium]